VLIYLLYSYAIMTQTMAWMLDEYSKFHGHSPAVVTGKPIVCEKNVAASYFGANSFYKVQ
jgi:glutamate dehydrogenase/leucine dehydrogenase